MAPSNKHEKAVRFVVEAIKAEHPGEAAKVRYGYRTSYGCIPDAFIAIAGKVLIVEVGDTSAEKIFKYLDDPKIWEIRWYTKKMELVGTWNRHDKGQKTFSNGTIKKINKKVRDELELEQIKNDIEHLKDERNELGRENGMYLNDQLYSVCPFCEETFRVVKGRIAPHGPYKILWCGKCRTNGSKE